MRHYRTRKTKPILDRLNAKLVSLPSGCIAYTGEVNNYGYGRIYSNTEHRLVLTHRVAWEAVNGKIPPKMTINHICRCRNCSNVNHMEILSVKDNVLAGISPCAQNKRKTHCKHGHLLDKSNTYITHNPKGRACRKCKNIWAKKNYHKMKEN